MKLKQLWYGTHLSQDRDMKRIQRLFLVSKDKQAQFRVSVIEHQRKHGVKSALDAYSISRATLFRWKKTLKNNNGSLLSLVPLSTRPKSVRQMIVNPMILSFISRTRNEYPIGKEKLKVLLDDFCGENNLKSVSESLIGKIILRYNIPKRSFGRIYHNPASKWAQKKRNYKLKVKHSPKNVSPGYIEIDTICQFNNGIRRYIINALDVNLKFKFSYPYTSLSSKTSLNFFLKFREVYPFPKKIHTVQTDNGLEFLGHFDKHLKEQNITHLLSYPRCPKINGFVERANRTLKEEFLNSRRDLLFSDLPLLKKELITYLLWYNIKRPHHCLGNISPIDYMLKKYPESHKCVTYTKC